MPKFTSILLFGLLLLGGCRWQSRPKDAAAIKANYSAFRAALLAQDHAKAASFVSAEYLALYAPEQVLDSFRYLAEPKMALTKDAWVEFDEKDESKACLFPQHPPTVGRGFTKETNEWKVTLHVVPVVTD